MTWTLVPTGDGWTITEGANEQSANQVSWGYGYTGADGSGTMTVLNGSTAGLIPTERSPSPITLGGRPGAIYDGGRVVWLTLDGVGDLVTIIESDSSAAIQTMVASLKVEQTALVEIDPSATGSTALVEG